MKKVLNLFMVFLLITSMVLPVFATEIASVRQDGAPTVSKKEETVDVVITPLVDQDKASWKVQQELKTATETLNEGDLTTLQSVQDAVQILNEQNAGKSAAEQTTAEIKAEDLVVSEVFHVYASEKNIPITFDAEGIKVGQFLMVMVFVDGQWVVLDADAVEILEDGKVRITFENYGVVAFVVNKHEAEAAANA